MGNELAGKVAVVTGSTGELGEVIAREMARQGATVIVSGRSHAIGEEIVGDIRSSGGSSYYVAADVSNPEDCRGLIRQTVDQFGRLDCLVNNAAHLGEFVFESLSPEDWDHVFATNLRGPMLLCQQVIPIMKEQGGGCIITIGTTTIHQNPLNNLNRLSYITSKGGLLTMTKAMGRALARFQIRSNWITVGWIATRGELKFRGETEQELQEHAKGSLPMGRLERPEEVAASVVYLASDQASHVTGCELNISGGLHI